MSQPAGTIQDGSLKFGSQQITVTDDPTTPTFTQIYLADNIDWDVTTKVISRPNEYGVVQAEVLIVEPGTGSMTLQVPYSGGAPVALPGFSTANNKLICASIKDESGTVTIPVKITKITRKFVADGETKIQVEFRQRFS